MLPSREEGQEERGRGRAREEEIPCKEVRFWSARQPYASVLMRLFKEAIPQGPRGEQGRPRVSLGDPGQWPTASWQHFHGRSRSWWITQVGAELPEDQPEFHLAYQHVDRCDCFWGPISAMG